MRYYAEGMSGYKEIGLPYSIDARVAVLERYSVTDGVFVEIGGDQPGEFHRECAPLFAKQILVDVTDDTQTDIRSVYDLEENSIDVLAHYRSEEHTSELQSH